LQKSDSEITNHSKTLSRGLENDAAGGEQIAGVIGKLNQSLNELRSAQLAIATEMGIQSTEAAN